MDILERERVLTSVDHGRLSKLVRHSGRAEARRMQAVHVEELLDSAVLVASRDVCADVVTMYSCVSIRVPGSAKRRTLTLCYPSDADPAAGFVSVLSPVGSSLLGLRVGDVAHWRTPAGGHGRAEVLALLFQPEASGDYSL
jgi:regulator of nucleoside diphosphate kinase